MAAPHTVTCFFSFIPQRRGAHLVRAEGAGAAPAPDASAAPHPRPRPPGPPPVPLPPYPPRALCVPLGLIRGIYSG